MKREPSAWGYNRATLPLGYINTETPSSRLGVGRNTDDLVKKKKKDYFAGDDYDDK
jgi:hypothetical protein